MHNKKIFIVVGMHRSGTSLVAQCLHSLGLNLSDSLVPSSTDNPDGFFEDAKIVEFNSAIESALNRSHMDVSSIVPFPRKWMEKSTVIKQAQKIKAYLKDSIVDHSPFLIKDPRICRMLPLYFNIFEELEISPIVIFAHRSPASVIRSKSKRDLLKPSLVETQWQISCVESLNSIYSSDIDIPVCFIGYENLLMNSLLEIERLEQFLSGFTAITNQNRVRPDIRNTDLAKQLKADSAKNRLTKFSLELSDFLINAKNVCLTDRTTPPKFQKLKLKFDDINRTAHPWVAVIDLMSAKLNSSASSLRTIARLQSDLKSTNGKVFSLTEQLTAGVVKLNKAKQQSLEIGENCRALENTKRQLEGDKKLLKGEMKQLNVEKNILVSENDALIPELSELTRQYEAIERDHRKLLLKNKTKIFKVADLIQNTKTRYFVSPLQESLRKLKMIKQETRDKAILVRRSVINNGMKSTIVRGVKVAAQHYSPAAKQDRSAVVIQKHQFKTEKVIGRALLKESALALTEEQIDIFLEMFVLDYYIAIAELDNNLPYSDALSHFVTVGLVQNLSPGPLFNAEYYLKKISRTTTSIEPAFLNWVKLGVDDKVVPTMLFDETYFLARHGLSSSADEWPFKRFVSLSIHNNATPNQYFEPNWYRQTHGLKNLRTPALYHYLVYGYKLGFRPSSSFPAYSRESSASLDISPMEYLMNNQSFDTYRSRLENSPQLLALVEQAANIEPKILQPGGPRKLNIQPFTNPYFPAIKELRLALKRSKYDSIVLIPHCRVGGSGLVAGELCRSLLRIRPRESILLIRTDNDDFMRPDWFPANIEILNLLDFGYDLPDVHRKKILLDVLVGTQPKRIFNVHSRLAWELISEYGDRLKSWSHLYAYTFCYDVNALGAKVGYPVKYVPNTIKTLDRLLVDNTFIKDDLSKENQWPEEIQNKVSVLWTPFQNAQPNLEKKPLVNLPPEKSTRRPTVFWAGRFDRQKRFDIVVKLAKRNPELDFYVWGAAMLGDKEPIDKIPQNILLQGLFKDYSEIPFNKCDVWLYTSQWDGVPTILIELGLRGVPLVASRIWGTSDLIGQDTAWPVEKVTDVNDYQTGIKSVLSNREAALKRAEKLRSLIKERHSRMSYDGSLEALVNSESTRTAK